MSMLDIDLNEVRILTSSSMELLEYDRVKKIESENNFLQTVIIASLFLGTAFMIYQDMKIKSKEFRNNYID